MRIAEGTGPIPHGRPGRRRRLPRTQKGLAPATTTSSGQKVRALPKPQAAHQAVSRNKPPSTAPLPNSAGNVAEDGQIASSIKNRTAGDGRLERPAPRNAGDHGADNAGPRDAGADDGDKRNKPRRIAEMNRESLGTQRRRRRTLRDSPYFQV